MPERGGSDVRLEHRRLRFLHLQDHVVAAGEVRALEQADPTPSADAPHPHYFSGDVGEAEPVEQVPHVVRQALPVRGDRRRDVVHAVVGVVDVHDEWRILDEPHLAVDRIGELGDRALMVLPPGLLDVTRASSGGTGKGSATSTSATSSRADHRSRVRIVAACAMCSRYERTAVATTRSQFERVKPRWRPTTWRLAASRFTSHSHGPGNVSSKSLMSNTMLRSGVANLPKFETCASPQAWTRSPVTGRPARSLAMTAAPPR